MRYAAQCAHVPEYRVVSRVPAVYDDACVYTRSRSRLLAHERETADVHGTHHVWAAEARIFPSRFDRYDTSWTLERQQAEAARLNPAGKRTSRLVIERHCRVGHVITISRTR